MNESHELKELDHKIDDQTRDEETLADYEENVIREGLGVHHRAGCDWQRLRRCWLRQVPSPGRPART